MSVADFARMTADRFKTAAHPADAALETLAAGLLVVGFVLGFGAMSL